MAFGKRWFSFVFTFLPVWGWVSLRPAFAQSITTATDGTGTVVTHDGKQFDITGGSLSGDGANLFHSFEQFGLNQSQAATFLTNPDIQNVLGRVVGGDASVINGLIEVTGSNANLYLLNPAGIIFGADATLNVPADFMAATADGLSFDDEWFSVLENNDYAALVGNPTELLFSNTQPGSILNAGDLAVSEDQNLSLVGGTVVNTGSLTAPGGNITVAAVPGTGRVNLSHDDLLLTLEFAPLDGVGPTPMSSPRSLPSLLTGGETAAITGVTTDEQGRLFLTSSSQPVLSEPGSAVVSGDINVAAETGGTVQVFGDQVSLVEASVDATGFQDGGEVLIGGDYLGEGSTPTATNTWVDGETVIAADATAQGDGGRVIVWADDATTFAGTITARGGAEGGNGGFVETSGKQTLDFTGATVDASAAAGLAGTWFLDPADIVIDAAQAIAAQTALGSGTNFELTTVGGTGGSGDITLQSDIDAIATNDATLTLTASRYITDGGTGSTIDITDGNLVMNLNQEGLAAEQNPTISDAVGVVGTITNGTTTLNLGAGTYREGAEINADLDITINGAGVSESIISGDGDADGSGDHRVFNTSGTVTLSNMTIRDGSTSNTGGGIDNSGDLTIDRVWITDNVSTARWSGGGIANRGTMTVSNSTISGNTGVEGGGLYLLNGSNNTFTNTTISGNTAVSDAGGAMYSWGGNTQITNSTITGNDAAGSGGAIFHTFGGSLVIENTLIAGNTSAGTSPDVSGTVTSNGTNLVGDLTGSTGFNADEESTMPIEEVLDTTLADNGGPTPTHALVADSPAINAGSDDVAPTTDQRLLSRVDTADIGAFEYGARPDLTIVSGDDQTTDVNTDFGSPLQVLITDANGDPYSNASVTFTLPTTGASGSFEDATSYTVITDADGLATTPIITANEISGSFITTVTIDQIGTLMIDGVEVAQFTLTSNATAPMTPATPTTEITTSILDGPPEAQPVESPVVNSCIPKVSLDTSEVIDSDIPAVEVDTANEEPLETDADGALETGSLNTTGDVVAACL